MIPHVMLDLETLATGADAAVIQLSAEAFDPTSGERIATFDRYINETSGRINLLTVAWWMQQSKAAAIGGMIERDSRATPEPRALLEFGAWIGSLGEIGGVWAYPPSFDLAILSASYRRNGMPQPWSYRIERCARTVFALAGGTPDVCLDPARSHDAAYDCEVQIKQLIIAAQRAGVTL